MRTILILLLAALAVSCKTKAPNGDGNCKTLGTVVDYDGLDGCGYLIKLSDGKLLNPITFPEGFQFKNGQSVRFDFQIMEDMASICMAESAMVKISCLEDVKAEPGPVDCAKIENPFAVDWMNKAIDRHNPVKIIKYQMGGKWAFAFQAVPTTFLYDCDGTPLCQTNGNEDDDCHRQYLNFISKGKTIWQGEGVWD